MSHWVLFVCEKFSKFVTLNGFFVNRDSRHIESVFAVLLRESDSFQKQKDIRTTPISCIVMCDYAFLGIYLILFKCGALYRLFLHRSFHNLLVDRRKSSPHFLFVYNPPHRRCYGSKLKYNGISKC